jgi:hypothetical protein
MKLIGWLALLFVALILSCCGRLWIELEVWRTAKCV